MKLRKINACLSLITTILLLVHSITYSISMISGFKIIFSLKPLSWILASLMVVHAVLSILLAKKTQKGAEKQNCKSYPKLNMANMMQRITGGAMLILTLVHIQGAFNYFHPALLHSIVQPLFFVVSLAHACVSVGRAFITLGIGNAKTIKIINILTTIVCANILILGVIGFYKCMFWGVG